MRLGFPPKAALACLLLATTSLTQAEKTTTPGLRVEEGRYLLNGKFQRHLGINYFDAFSRMLGVGGSGHNVANKSYREGFKVLHEHGIPFIRFNCGGFYPSDWRLYRENPALYFQLLDEFVAEAERQNLGLIPSLFWAFITVPNIVGEPLSSWGTPESKTVAFMRKYVTEVVGRYKDSRAIWGWEFGNEYSLEADLPKDTWNISRWYESSYGMPAKPVPEDRLTSTHIRAAYVEFAKAVRALDPHRAIFTGDSTPRTAVHHLSTDGTWQPDSREEWIAALIQSNPDPVDTLSIHFYPYHTEAGTGLKDQPFKETLQACLQAAKESGKPLWVGEFGASENPDKAVRQEQFQAVLDLILAEKIQLSAVWVFDFPYQPFNTIAKEDLETLETLARANQQLQSSP